MDHLEVEKATAADQVCDSSVPVSNLPKLVYDTKRDLAALGIVNTIVGHIGDGNFHCLLLFSNEEEQAIVRNAVHKMVDRAIALDGTCKAFFSWPPFASDKTQSNLNNDFDRHWGTRRGHREARVPLRGARGGHSRVDEDHKTYY